MRKKLFFICFIFLLLVAIPNISLPWSGEVVDVADGDIITALRDGKPEEISLYGIDCPERDQAFGKKAKQFTSDVVFGKTVFVESMAKDRYGREVGLVFVGKTLLNEELVKNGLAWVYWKYCHHPICESWKNFQLRARIDKRGVWADSNPVSPWEFRRQRRER